MKRAICSLFSGCCDVVCWNVCERWGAGFTRWAHFLHLKTLGCIHFPHTKDTSVNVTYFRVLLCVPISNKCENCKNTSESLHWIYHLFLCAGTFFRIWVCVWAPSMSHSLTEHSKWFEKNLYHFHAFHRIQIWQNLSAGKRCKYANSPIFLLPPPPRPPTPPPSWHSCSMLSAR